MAEAISEDEIRQQVTKELSTNRQIWQTVIVSVVGFIVSLVLAFYLFNGGT